VNLEDPVVLRNLSELDVGKVLYDAFKTAINALTIQVAGTTRIEDRIRLRETRPFRTEPRPYLAASKSIFTKTVGEAHSGGFELSFAAFLEAATDVAAFAKNYLAIGFKLDYVKADGDLSTYTPDFIVRTTDGVIWIVETKGRQDLDLPQKMARPKQWCADATAAKAAEDGFSGQRYDFAFADQHGFEKHAPKTFAALATSFTEYTRMTMSDRIQTPEPRIALFQRKEVRRTIHNNEWWFVITDVITILTDSVDPSQYLKRIRQRDPQLNEAFKGGVQLVPGRPLPWNVLLTAILRRFSAGTRSRGSRRASLRATDGRSAPHMAGRSERVIAELMIRPPKRILLLQLVLVGDSHLHRAG
jgi:hypothetical protein